jgi:hypothetical protein
MTNCYLSIKNIDKFRRSFFWRGKPPNQISGGHCLVNWATCLRPRKWGGLGFKDLEKFVNGIGGVWGGGGGGKKKNGGGGDADGPSAPDARGRDRGRRTREAPGEGWNRVIRFESFGFVRVEARGRKEEGEGG